MFCLPSQILCRAPQMCVISRAKDNDSYCILRLCIELECSSPSPEYPITCTLLVYIYVHATTRVCHDASFEDEPLYNVVETVFLLQCLSRPAET